MEYRPVRRTAIASRLLTNALVRKGLLGRKGRYVPRTAAKPAARVASKVVVVKRKKNQMRAVAPKPARGGLPSYSGWVAKRKPSARVLAMKRVGAPNFDVTNFATFVKNQEGFQNAISFGHNNIDFLRNILSKISFGTGKQISQFVLEQSTSEFLVTNSSLATQYVDIYDIVRKRDTQYSDVSGGVPNNPTLDPVNAWKWGVSDQIISAGDDLTAWQNVTSLPTDSRLFNNYFRIVKRTRVGLVAGATHRHRVHMGCNQLLDKETLNRAYGDLRGITTYTMMVINGQPTSIPSAEGGDPVVTTAQTQLDVVYSIRAKYTWVADNTITWYVTDNLSSLTGEQITQPSLGKFVTNQIV